MPVINAQNCGDQYTDALTIKDIYPTPNGGGWYSLANNGNAALCEVQFGPEYGTTQFGDEQLLNPGSSGTIPNNASGIRFRNAVAGKQANITCVLVPHDQPALGVSSVGVNVSVVSGSSINFQHNDLAVATEPTLDIEDGTGTGITWTVVDDPANTRVKVTAQAAVISVFGRTGAVVATSGDYTAAQVTNAADKSSAAAQVFTGAITTTQLTTTSNSGVVAQSVAGSPAFRNFLLAADANPAYVVNGSGATSWGSGGAAAVDVGISRTAAGILNLSTGTIFSLGGITNSSLTNQGALFTTGGGIQQVGAAAATVLTAMGVAGNSNYGLTITAAGTHLWGPGTGAGDTTLSRSGVGVLTLANVLACGAVEPGFGATGFSTTPNTFTPNYALQAFNQITQTVTAAATLNIASASNPPASTQTGFLAFRIVNNGTGALAITWTAQYAGTTIALPNTLANATTLYVLFIWNGNTSTWQLLLRS
jgi:hypothetical protein